MAITFTMKAPAEIMSRLGLGKNGIVQRVIDSEVLSRCEPYVPKKTGALIESGREATRIGSGSVTYGAPYAAYQYYGRSAKGNPLSYNGAPMRGSFWFERMKEAHSGEILRLAAAAAGASVSSVIPDKSSQVPLNQPVKTVIGLRRNPVFR